MPEENSAASTRSISVPDVTTAIESVTGSTFVTISGTVATDNEVTSADILSSQLPQGSSVASPGINFCSGSDNCN